MSRIKRIPTIFEHRTAYHGWQPVEIEAFRTKRGSSSVTRYRYRTPDGWGSSYSCSSVEDANNRLRALERSQSAWWRRVEAPAE